MKISRRGLVGSAAGVAFAAPFVARAQQAEFTYKYANNLPLAHPMNIRAKEMADAIKAETNGRIEINIFPSNQLGSDTDMLSQLRSGALGASIKVGEFNQFGKRMIDLQVVTEGGWSPANFSFSFYDPSPSSFINENIYSFFDYQSYYNQTSVAAGKTVT